MRAVATRAGEFTIDGFIKRSIVSHYQPYTYRYLIQCYSFIIIRLLFITSHIFSSRALVRAWIGHVNHMPHHSPHLSLALHTPTAFGCSLCQYFSLHLILYHLQLLLFTFSLCFHISYCSFDSDLVLFWYTLICNKYTLFLDLHLTRGPSVLFCSRTPLPYSHCYPAILTTLSFLSEGMGL